jgi:hypothetical protein
MKLLLTFLPRNLKERFRVTNALKFLELFNSKYLCLISNMGKFKHIKVRNIEPLVYDEKVKSWNKYYRYLDEILDKYDFDELLIFYTPLYESYHFGNEKKLRKQYEKSFINNKFILKNNFNTFKNFYIIIFTVFYIIQKFKDKNIKQIIYDPQELSYKNICSKIENYFFYDSKKLNAKYLPFAEYGYFYNVKNDIIKKIDFVFGYTILTKDRMYLENIVKNIKIFNKEIYVKNKYTKEDNYINYNEYYNKLKEAKFTLVVPSYDINEFSSIRFFEALGLDCIPLILENCKWRQAFYKYPEFEKIIEKYLLVSDSDSIKRKINQYDFLLKKLKETKDYKKLKNIDYYKKYIRGF